MYWMMGVTWPGAKARYLPSDLSETIFCLGLLGILWFWPKEAVQMNVKLGLSVGSLPCYETKPEDDAL